VPKYDPREYDGLDYYSRVKMMLRYPFKEVEDLLTVEQSGFWLFSGGLHILQ